MRKDLVERFGSLHPRFPILVTIPHSGEVIPPEASWLAEAPPSLLTADIDRFVDRLFRPISASESLPAVMTHVHRYAADLNRFPTDVDMDSVEGSTNPPGSFRSGFHWVRSMAGAPILRSPIPAALHDAIVRAYHDPFHSEIARLASEIESAFPARGRWHIELHSMPSRGIDGHEDPGSERPEITVSDCEGTSCDARLREAVMGAFRQGGFDVVLNHPYKGGRNTQRYGKPDSGLHAIQIEINRKLYLDERTRDPLPDGGFERLQGRLAEAFRAILRAGEKNSV